MAQSASLAITPSVVTNNQIMTATLTLSNPPGGTSVSVVRIDPFLLTGTSTNSPYAPGQSGKCPIVIGASTTLSPSASAAATLTFSWQVTAYAPPAPLNPPYPSTPAYDTYTVGAAVRWSDGTESYPTTTIEVYPLVSGSTLAFTTMPGNGSLRFDSNVESGLAAAVPAAAGALTGHAVPTTALLTTAPYAAL